MDFDAQVERRCKSAIRDVPDFPKPGIVFKDITTLLRDPVLFRRSLDLLTVLCGDLRGRQGRRDREPRASSWAAPWRDRLGAGFVPVRKPGKLPWKSRQASYELEYGKDTLEIHDDALRAGRARAGGGRRDRDRRHRGGGRRSSRARSARRVAGFAFLVELGFLNGRARLAGHEVRSLIRY